MLYEPTNTPAMARTSNLNEELGQVNEIMLYKRINLPTFQSKLLFFPLCLHR